MMRTVAGILAYLSTMLPFLPAAAETNAPTTSGDRPYIEELIRIPRTGAQSGILTQICRPRGLATAPLVVINHGRPAGATDKERRDKRAKMKPWTCGLLASTFWSRGYVVAFPLRRGYGETGGSDHENTGSCNAPDYYKSANAAADDIEATIKYLKSLPYVAKGRTIVIGQSAGGLATMALAARKREGIAAYINFAGGLGGRRNNEPNNNCAPGALVSAIGRFGRTGRAPMLWVYTENDTFFGPTLARQMFKAFQDAGGTADFVMVPPFQTAYTNDGHLLLTASGGHIVWEPIVFQWLEKIKTQ